jgi:hypothetical protein
MSDDIVDEVESGNGARSTAAPAISRYREALTGVDPHLSDACDLTLQRGANILRDQFPFQKPVFRLDGSIPANIGRYRIARKSDDTAALLFAFDPDDLKEPDLTKDAPAGRLERLHVVYACQSVSPAHWAYPEIIKHQQALQERALTQYTLYQTGPDVWSSDEVGYALYPVKGSDAQGGEPKFSLWMFSNTSNTGEFTQVRERAPATLLENGLHMGSKLGDFSRADAIMALRQDFAHRVRRAAEGRDPVTTGDKLRNPFWLAARSWQHAQHYFASNKPLAIALDGVIATVNLLDGPIGFVKNKLVDLVSYVRQEYADGSRPLEITDSLARIKRTARGFDPVLRDADPAALAGYRLTDANSSRAVPLGEPVTDEIHETFSQRRLLSIMVGTDGAIARLRHNGIVSLRHANGIKVDHAPDGATSYIRYNPDDAVEVCRALRPREANLFTNDRVLRICRRGCETEVQHLTGEQFLAEIQEIQDQFAARKQVDARNRLNGPDVNGLRAEFTGDRRQPIRWRNRLKGAAETALEAGDPADQPLKSSAADPTSPVPQAKAAPANDRGRKPGERGLTG